MSELDKKVVSHRTQGKVTGIPGIKNIIAIVSGKGGVGKSTVAVNLALAVQQLGFKVGLLDADIYGPSLPSMLGTKRTVAHVNEEKIQPITAFGMPIVSMGYLVEEDSAMIWRGPMVSQALQQLLFQTAWPELDYLIIDLPPGTGDIQLTLAQKIPVSGAVVVTTPQDVALLDVRKAYHMLRKVNITVLGVIENMSTHICSQCGHQEAIFGEGGGARLAKQYDVSLLAQLPLSLKIRVDLDNGTPTVALDPHDPISVLYIQAAERMLAQLALQPKDFSKHFTNIVVESNNDNKK